MPLWGNTDTQGAKPKFPAERQAESKQATVVASQTSNTRTLSLNSATAILNAQVGLTLTSLVTTLLLVHVLLLMMLQTVLSHCLLTQQLT